ncbi:2-oxo acid dehydrogenase subunit E2 [Bordetella petrii]|uniref:2-oxo acid dehydrogenase subunit E2 n=1 Tax=Bordetella petrii TaxID=94624 RepID=UPI00372FFBA2
MANLIRLPAVAADASGGTLHQWLKREGDAVAVGEPLAEIETEKAIVEINAEQAGVLGRIVVPAGAASVPVNAVLGVLLETGEDAAAIEAALAGHADASAPAGAGAGADDAATAQPGGTPAASPTPGPAPDATIAGRVLASPLARRLAAQWNLDLAALAGSGPRGRVVRRDVEAAARCAPASASAAPPPAAVPAARLAEQRVPHTGMRRAIARRLSESKQTVPHFYLTVDCRADALLALRAQAGQDGGARPTVNDFIVRAAAQALRDEPGLNVSWQDDALLHHAGADISVAVATDGGLVTPIVRDADAKPLGAIAAEIAELAARARANRLRPEEFTGGSLTVSNLGMHGIDQFAAIINPPQAAILAVGAARRRPVVDEDGEIRAAMLMTVTLSADHRAVDGAVAARWLAAFRARIEHPVRILL